MITADRANELAEIFEGRSRAPLSMDAPGCVVTNLRPATLMEVAEALRAYSVTANKVLDLASLLALKVPVDPVAAKDPKQRDAQIRMRGHIHTAIRRPMTQDTDYTPALEAEAR